MPVVEHLAELRNRLFICLIAVGVAAIGVFVVYEPILRFLKHPYCEALPKGRDCDFFVTSPLAPFGVRLQIATYGGLILAAPVVFWQLWRFIAPGLHARERRYAMPFLMTSIVLFALGGFIAYLTFPKALHFLITIGGTNLDVRLDPIKYVSLILLMILAFGLSFEFPVLLVFLQLVGVLTPQTLLKGWRYALLAIFVLAAVITPSGDPYSMLALAIPMTIFYFMAVVIGVIFQRRKRAAEARA